MITDIKVRLRWLESLKQGIVIAEGLLRHHMIHLSVFINEEKKKERKKKGGKRIFCLPIGKTRGTGL